MEGLRPVHWLASLLAVLLFCHGRGSEQRPEHAKRGGAGDMPERDVTSPLATVPTVTTPAAMPTATPATQAPSLAGGGGGSWCVASPSASSTSLQVALDYACGQGGADCSPIQQGGSCFNPDTVRDHASYAFNSYYQKNPVQTSCDFGGTAVLTSTNPSTSTCQFPATSTGGSVLNTSTPLTPTYGSPPGGYGSSPPAGYGNSPPLYGNMSPPDYGDNISAAVTVPGSKTTTTTIMCFLIATLTLTEVS
ncbi:unnamed protein product [Urochloa decumbens]|uniref:X8 domain-containing protein n=1 Tax=Urochloa decumbens TaxID=240449 RepID=A0ABC9GL25_9POAL